MEKAYKIRTEISEKTFESLDDAIRLASHRVPDRAFLLQVDENGLAKGLVLTSAQAYWISNVLKPIWDNAAELP